MKTLIKNTIQDGLKIGLLTLAVGAVAALLMVHVWNQYRIMAVGYEIAEVTAEHRKLLERNKKLSIEAAVVGRTERLTTVARQRYGLEPITPEQVRFLRTERDQHAALHVE